MGDGLKVFSHVLDLVTEERGQVRDNALESVRMAINRFLNNKLGKDGYFMKIRVYPYHILRENKQAQGAGADRVSQGMSHAFGRNIGRAIRLHKGQEIISILVDEQNIETAKVALSRANAKMGIKLSVKVGTDVASIGTKPKKTKELKEEEEKKEEIPTEAEKKEAGKAEEKGAAKGAAAKGPAAKAQAGKAPAGKGQAGKAEAKKEEAKPAKKK